MIAASFIRKHVRKKKKAHAHMDEFAIKKPTIKLSYFTAVPGNPGLTGLINGCARG